MGEYELVRFLVVSAGPEKIPLGYWNVADSVTWSLGGECCFAAVGFPSEFRVGIMPAVEQHFFVVAENGNQLAAVTQVDQEVQHFATVWSTVDVVSQRDNRVLRAGDDGFQKGLQRRRVAVDVADGDQATGF